jgi:TPP-dependent pyruvate/acetoin dehydrogenase alpha subunit
MKWTKEALIEFESDLTALFNEGKIKAPLHLAGGNEDQLIKIFEDIAPQDWICCSWRSHYHCLLKGVPPAEVKAAIVNGRSIALCFPRQNVISSAIVGGILPIGMGLAWALKREYSNARVHCFVGDMTAKTGIYDEVVKYAIGHSLPITFIEEDNGLSVFTNTETAWGKDQSPGYVQIKEYDYELTTPHVGTGQWVSF